MLVTFISECEKNALKRTRRVLDAFANRIGNNTWQTPITAEGLDAVKKLLRKTASKNTAVSCHQLKSRVRTELLWVVGKREKFNNEGIVAVNYTEQNKFIGEVNMSEIYANTKKQPLDQHLFAVGVVAQEIMKTFCPDEQLQKAAFMAGCWHDIGKLEAHFQDWLNKELKKKNLITELPENGVHIESGSFYFKKYPTHNEVSTLIYELLADDSNFGTSEKQSIKHAIFWHHAKPNREDKDDICSLMQIKDKLKDNDIKTLISQSRSILQKTSQLANKYFDKEFIKFKQDVDFDNEIKSKKLPAYKIYETAEQLTNYQTQIKDNSKENLIRTAVISADRLVSSLSSDELQNYINNQELNEFAKGQFISERGLNQHITTCRNGFDKKYPNSERNKQQSKVAENLADNEKNISVLNGPAGCGKTKIALEWALNVSAKQILWVCPRVAICQSLFKDLSNDEYLPNATIEIHTGEFKYNNKINELNEQDYFKGDIVLTTIDQIINGITTHRNISTLTLFMNATVVFDEFHEYVLMAGLNILFAELIQCKQLQQNTETMPNTLLVSATPNYYFVKDFLGISEDEIEGIQSFNDKEYQIEFVDYDETLEDENNPLYQKVAKNTFVISNTAITAQKSFIYNQTKENGLLTHSKFTPKDREDIFKKVIDSFGTLATGTLATQEKGTNQFDVLRSGSIIQAALNISCQNMITEMSTAENILQRLGRLNRFAEFDAATLKIALTESVKTGKQTGKLSRFLAHKFQWQSTKVWVEFLQDKLSNNQIVVINDLYKWYQEFYENEENENRIKMIEQDFIDSLKESVRVIKDNVYEPKRIKLSKNSQIKLKKHSLRGNSRFVNMAIYDVETKQVLNKYLNVDITLSVDEIQNYGDDESPLNFMGKKHHNIKADENKKYGVTKTTKYKTKLYLEKSRDPETPIYVSYTPKDLEIVNATEETAIYYLQGINQAIGIMAISKLKNDKQ